MGYAKKCLPASEVPLMEETVVMDFTTPQKDIVTKMEKPAIGIIKQRAISVGQIVEGSSEKEFTPECLKKGKQAVCVLPQNTGTGVSDIQIAYKEAPLQDLAMEHQSAQTIADVQRTFEVTQIHVNQKESPLVAQRPVDNYARRTLVETVVPVIQQDILLENSIIQKPEQKLSTETASVVLPKYDALSVSDIVEGDSEATLDSITIPEAKQAVCVQNQNTETCVVNIQESPLKDFCSGQPQLPKPSTEEQYPVEVTQLTPIETTPQVDQKEKPKRKKKEKPKKPIINTIEQEALIVSQIVENSNTKDLVADSKHPEKKA